MTNPVASAAYPRLSVVLTTTRGDIHIVAPVTSVQIAADVNADGFAHPKQTVRLRALPTANPRNGCALTFPTPESLFDFLHDHTRDNSACKGKQADPG